MDHAPFVRVFQRVGDLHRDLPGLLERHRAFGRFALDQFHDQRPLFDAVNLGDIGVIERSQHFGLALEARHATGIGGEGLGQNLHGHITLQLRVPGTVHLAHAAGVDKRKDLVASQMVPYG